jgi:hypothetical protein
MNLEMIVPFPTPDGPHTTNGLKGLLGRSEVDEMDIMIHLFVFTGTHDFMKALQPLATADILKIISRVFIPPLFLFSVVFPSPPLNFRFDCVGFGLSQPPRQFLFLFRSSRARVAHR